MKKKCVCVLLMLVIIMVTGCGGSKETDKKDSKSNVSTTEERKETTDEKIKNLEGKSIDTTIKRLKQYGYKGKYYADGVDFTDFIDDVKDDYVTGKLKINKEKKTVKVELILASNQTAKDDEEKLEKKLQKGAAWAEVKKYGKNEYGEDFKLHILNGLIADNMDDKDTWLLKAECTVNGKKMVCEAKVTGTTDYPEVKYFDVY